MLLFICCSICVCSESCLCHFFFLIFSLVFSIIIFNTLLNTTQLFGWEKNVILVFILLLNALWRIFFLFLTICRVWCLRVFQPSDDNIRRQPERNWSWAGNADRGTTRNWLNGKLVTAVAAAAVAARVRCSLLAALCSLLLLLFVARCSLSLLLWRRYLRTHTHTLLHSHRRLQCSRERTCLRAFARGTVDGSLSGCAISLACSLARSLARAWFISGRCVWYSFVC